MSKRRIPKRRVVPKISPLIKKTLIWRKPKFSGGTTASTSSDETEEPSTTSTSPTSSTSNNNTMEPFIGQIIMFGGNFAPRGWALCEGQLLSISSNTALFSILGTIYGGDGRTSFGLPDMRGRVSMHAGHGPGLANRRLGAKEGAENVNISAGNMPNHTHNVTIVEKGSNPTGGTPNSAQAAALDSTSSEIQTSTSATGNNQALNNMQPFMVVNYIIALEGVYPSRS